MFIIVVGAMSCNVLKFDTAAGAVMAGVIDPVPMNSIEGLSKEKGVIIISGIYICILISGIKILSNISGALSCINAISSSFTFGSRVLNILYELA